jgi:hypothetical protein
MPMDSAWDDPVLPGPGCPIRISPDQSLLSGSPKLNAASHVLLRLLAPRHPPYALSSLTIFANTTQQLKLQLLPVFSCQRTTPSPLPPPSKKGYVKGAATNPERLVNGTLTKRPSLSSLQLVELIGIEPTTSGLQNRRSPN